MTEHPYDPDRDAPGYCTCGVQKRNRWHTDATVPLPAVTSGHTATSHDHPETSYAAAAAAQPTLGSLRSDLLNLLADASTGAAGGMTDDELEATTGRPHQSVSATRRGMVIDGFLTPAKRADGTPRTRPTRSGSPATVWTLTPSALDLTGAPR